MRNPLPVDAVLPQVVAALRRESSVVLQAPTGAGKTTRVPPALLDAGGADNGLIVVLEPRRIAAQAAAARMAAERGESAGETMGYQVRFQRRAGSTTRVLVVTEGILLRMLLDDPWLEKVAVVVFDEFHERTLNSDLALAMVRRLQVEFRPELKIIVMSATLDPQPLAQYLGCSTVESPGRLFPVEISYLPLPDQRPLPAAVADGIANVWSQSAGHVLAFLPGVGEIRRVHEELARRHPESEAAICELYGDLPLEKQQEVLTPGARRRVILSTNVAETSVTIEGVTAVVDTGMARVLRCDVSIGLNRLSVERISRASADQRAGRAGRTAPGLCLRLWTQQEHRFLQERDTPEILRLDLAGPRLTLLAWGEENWESFPWLEPPPPAAWENAGLLLRRLGAVDGQGLTDLGRQLAQLPVHPRLARLLVEGTRQGCSNKAALAAALLAERDPFLREQRREAQHVSPSDLLDRVHALEQYQSRFHVDSVVGRLSPQAAKQVLRAQQQLLRTAEEVGLHNNNDRDDVDAAFLRATLAAFPDRVARRRDAEGCRAVMVGGRGVVLADRSAVRQGAFFVGVDVEEIGGADALVRQASWIDPQWLPDHLLRTSVEADFDESQQRVRSVQRTRYDDLILAETYSEKVNADEIARVLAAAASKQIERVLALDDDHVAQFLARVRSLRLWMPQLGLPEFSDDDWRAMLPQLCAGRRSFQELRSLPLLDYLRGAITREQLLALDREAPERIPAASGNRIRLQYQPGRPPIMAVRIQEMFGQLDTPRVAGGRVTVLLHLLAPNMRPQQITDDLRGFWERGYPIVRKELRRRYPKHAWPDDPAHAAPERRPQRKR